MAAWTARDLLRAMGQGAVIEHRETGERLKYAPRRDRDRETWMAEGSTVRYSSSECVPRGRSGGPWALAKALRINVR
jgi:hypothetical protein